MAEQSGDMQSAMEAWLDLDRFPLDDLTGADGSALVANCRQRLARDGLFSLEGFVRPPALKSCIDELRPHIRDAAFAHRREHNIYFDDNNKFKDIRRIR